MLIKPNCCLTVLHPYSPFRIETQPNDRGFNCRIEHIFIMAVFLKSKWTNWAINSRTENFGSSQTTKIDWLKSQTTKWDLDLLIEIYLFIGDVFTTIPQNSKVQAMSHLFHLIQSSDVCCLTVCLRKQRMCLTPYPSHNGWVYTGHEMYPATRRRNVSLYALSFQWGPHIHSRKNIIQVYQPVCLGQITFHS